MRNFILNRRYMQADKIILFDGSCAFCNGFIRWVIRMDRVHFRLCDQQSACFQALARQHGLPLATGTEAGTIYLVQHGKAYTRTAAIARILRGCRQPFGLAGWLLSCIPAFISNPVYNWIARRRHQLVRKQACALPTLEMRERLV